MELQLAHEFTDVQEHSKYDAAKEATQSQDGYIARLLMRPQKKVQKVCTKL